MIFTDRDPKTWKELQDRVAMLMSQAGYLTMSPYIIETARGSVEVDVFVESPDPLIKLIVCECKYWKRHVSQEKVHAFQTVVHNSGASLGLMISKCGFQTGAIEAARYSNVKLVTWEEFIGLICERWIINMLLKIKKACIPLREYTNMIHFPYEELKSIDKLSYNKAYQKYSELIATCIYLSKDDVLSNDFGSMKYYQLRNFESVEAYLNFLDREVELAVNEFQNIIAHSNIVIPAERFDKSDIYTHMF